MSQPRTAFNKDHEDIIKKFSRLLEKAHCGADSLKRADGTLDGETMSVFSEVRASALNLLARTAGESSIYYRMLHEMHPYNTLIGFYPGIMIGILSAVIADFHEGFMADTKLLISAEVFADFLVQAEVLLEHDYKDAAAVIIRAVLEDALRRVCVSNRIEVRDRAGIDELKTELTKQTF